jgi:hypothetical protein
MLESDRPLVLSFCRYVGRYAAQSASLSGGADTPPERAPSQAFMDRILR